MLTISDYEKCKRAFADYVSKFDLEDDMIKRKKEHSYKVADLMEEVSLKLSLLEEEVILAKIIGLLHDIGRFEQIKKFHSFSDKNVDHADESCDYLFKEGHIRDFLDERAYDKLIEHAIRYHNKLEIKSDDNVSNLLFAKMIRDMDKVDIFLQCIKTYDYRFGYDEISPKVLESFITNKSISYKEVKTKSDSVLLVFAFLFDFNFKESLQMLKESGNFLVFVDSINIEESARDDFEKLKSICLDSMERRVGE